MVRGVGGGREGRGGVEGVREEGRSFSQRVYQHLLDGLLLTGVERRYPETFHRCLSYADEGGHLSNQWISAAPSNPQVCLDNDAVRFALFIRLGIDPLSCLQHVSCCGGACGDRRVDMCHPLSCRNARARMVSRHNQCNQLLTGIIRAKGFPVVIEPAGFPRSGGIHRPDLVLVKDGRLHAADLVFSGKEDLWTVERGKRHDFRNLPASIAFHPIAISVQGRLLQAGRDFFKMIDLSFYDRLRLSCMIIRMNGCIWSDVLRFRLNSGHSILPPSSPSSPLEEGGWY